MRCKITEKRFEELKKRLKVPKDDKIVAKKEGISATTAYRIRKCGTYIDYLLLVSSTHGAKGKTDEDIDDLDFQIYDLDLEILEEPRDDGEAWQLVAPVVLMAAVIIALIILAIIGGGQ